MLTGRDDEIAQAAPRSLLLGIRTRTTAAPADSGGSATIGRALTRRDDDPYAPAFAMLALGVHGARTVAPPEGDPFPVLF